ncbi:uncharacterized [Tachysurus ichikawai]
MLMWQMFWVVLMLTELQHSLFQLASLSIDAPLHTFAHFCDCIHEKESHSFSGVIDIPVMASLPCILHS